MKAYRCPSCGAPLEYVVCPYCGTTVLTELTEFRLAEEKAEELQKKRFGRDLNQEEKDELKRRLQLGREIFP